MRPIRLLVAIHVLAVGLALGALTPQPVVLDLGIASWHATLGVGMLAALLVGVIAGGVVVTASMVLPLRQRLRKALAAAATPAER
jgi:uncharacterized integral membrane protein